ncbi:MAG: transglutaminase domain-containing protein [Thermoplasmata archaeon]|nr:transglutaminase domain-containing protein [Thermoplasmata archaeon]
MPDRLSAAVTYYTRQSLFTDPGKHQRLFADLPNGISGLCQIVQGLVVHYRSQEVVKARLPRERLREVDTRLVSRMLARLAAMDERPLSEPRPVERRIVGCCRDFAVLFCAMARHQGIPCRVRVGFATYFRDEPAGFHVDHTIAEVWDRGAGRWHLVDPEQSERLVEYNRLPFVPIDVPRDRFLVGGRAWQLCRESQADPRSFGVESRGSLRGLWFVRSRLILDFCSLNRQELLLWDAWRPMDPTADPIPAALARYDRIADLTQRGNEALGRIHRIFESTPSLRPPRTVWSFSPVAKPRRSRLPSPTSRPRLREVRPDGSSRSPAS